MFGCNSSDQKSDVLVKANQVHIEAMGIASKLEKSLDSLRKEKSGTAQVARLDSIAQLIELWEESVMEVPGFDHDHEHGEGHHHKPAPQMTDESMLEYQLKARKAIESIRAQVVGQDL